MFPVFFDTCALFGQTLCDVVLSIGATGAFVPYWSEEVLDAIERNVVETGRASPEKIHYRIEQMQLAFPHSCVTDYEALVPSMTNHPGDRHVLAACITSPAHTLVTFNVADFPKSSTDPYGITIVDPDEFLLDQLDLHPALVRQGLEDMLLRNQQPPQDLPALADTLEASGVPAFAQSVLALADPLA